MLKTIKLSARELKAILAAAGKNDVRYYLNGFHIDTSNNRIISTDGSRALILELTHHTGDDVIEAIDPITVERPHALPKPNDDVFIEIGSNAVTIRYSSGLEFTAKVIDAQFPNIDNVFPKGSEAVDSIGINPALLADITKVLKCNARLSFTGPEQSMRIEFSGYKHITGILMPVRDKVFD